MKKILYNANVITMEDELYSEAILIENGIIKGVGTNEEILDKKEENTEVIDMNKKTILPAFIDSHSHFSAVANSYMQLQLNDCTSFDEIRNKITNYINQNGIKENEWIIASGYDHNNLKEQKHPKKDFLDSCDRVLRAIDNDVLRVQVDNYIQIAISKYEEEMKKANKKTKEKEINKIKMKSFADMAEENPILYDYYIKLKEQDTKEIQNECLKEVNEQLSKLIDNAKTFCAIVKDAGYIANESISAKDESRERIKFFKHVIEDCDAYKNLYYSGKKIAKEDDLNRMFRFVWMNSKFKADFETNNGRGEADVVVSKGSNNQCVAEFKLASNTRGLKKVFEQADIYCKANGCIEKIIVVFYFEEKEYKNVQKWINENNLGKFVDQDIFLIDCRNDNKISGSKL